MSHLPQPAPAQSLIRISPLVLSDRLLTLAQDADRAGLRAAADKLVQLAHVVCDSPAWA